jgi:hypothetical protein
MGRSLSARETLQTKRRPHMFKRFFRYLINATEPATETALRRPATAERNARGEKARKRYIEIAATLKAEAGITHHTAHKKMTGRASLTTGAIFAPAGATREARAQASKWEPALGILLASSSGAAGRTAECCWRPVQVLVLPPRSMRQLRARSSCWRSWFGASSPASPLQPEAAPCRIFTSRRSPTPGPRRGRSISCWVAWPGSLPSSTTARCSQP